MKLSKPVAFHVPGDPPQVFNERFDAGTPVRVLQFKDCSSEDQHAFRMRAVKEKTHIIVEVGGVARLLEREYVE